MNRRRFCPQGHDTERVGRDQNYWCKQCKSESAWLARRKREQEAAADWERRRLAEIEKANAAREAREAEILALGGPDALDLMQRRAFEDGKCGWYEDDDVEVCQRRTDPETFVWCRKHNRELDRRQEAKRTGG